MKRALLWISLFNPITWIKRWVLEWAIDEIERGNVYRVVKCKIMEDRVYIELSTGEWRRLGRK